MNFKSVLILAGLIMEFSSPGAPSAEGIGAGESALISGARQLTYDGRRSGEGYFSPDGQALIFQSEREAGNPFYQMYVLDLETGETVRVSPGTGKTTCGFFRPGTDRVLFASTHPDPEAKAKQEAEIEFRASGKTRRYSWDYDAWFDLFTANRDGSGAERLTHAPGYDAEGAYSPDGEWVVFTSLRTAYPTNLLNEELSRRLEVDPSFFGEIYVMRADGSEQRRLTFAPGYDGGPFFSPDGERIVWRRFNEAGTQSDVYTMNRDGTDARRVTDFDCMSWAPYFHPSGEYLIFTANKHGFENFELFIVDSAGRREPVRVTFTDGFDGLPVFSPDGGRLCWTANRTSSGQSQLFLGNWNHEAAMEELAESPRRQRGPASARAGQAGGRGVDAAQAGAGLSAEITDDDLKAHVEHLASDRLEGRLTGTEGSRLASEYIAERLAEAGVAPSGEGGGWHQSFEFTAGVEVAASGNELSVQRLGGEAVSISFEVEKDFRPLAFTANDTVESEVVFAGYGLVVPGEPGTGYDSYAGLDVSNKIALVLRYVPEGVTAERRAELNRYAGPRYKAMMAREHGAKAMLVVTGPNSPNSGELIRLSSDGSLAGSGIVAASVTTEVAEALLAGTGKELGQLQSALDTENPHAEGGFEIPDARAVIGVAVERIRKTDRNVLGVVPAGVTNGVVEYVLLGAHYDHLGRGEGGSREHGDEAGEIHNGADDNASGVAAVLEIAAKLAEERSASPEDFPRGVMFALWSGEELGLIGSSHFAEHPVVPLTNVAAYLNFDMVGRLRENRLTLQGAGSSPVWRGIIERRNVGAGFDLNVQEDPYLPTDTTALYPHGVPVLSFFTGSHDDYHRPTDEADRVNHEGLGRITRFAHGLARDLARVEERPEYVKVERARGGGNRDALRVYLGTIPDYTTEVAGVKLSGVAAKGPADMGGLKGGDVIVEFAGQQIENIYDYTYALDAAKIGEPVKVVVVREGERVELTIVPEARR